MFPALLTTVFFSLSAIFASRSARLLGAAVANLGRMLAALVMLGIWAHTGGAGLHGPSLPWFFASGFVGYGLGDIALFQAFTRIGPRLTMLVVHCMAVPFAAIMENLWLGTRLRPDEIVCVCIILSGVALALTPARAPHLKAGLAWTGTLFALGASMGQAGGAVISRKAYAVAALSGIHIDGGTAAYQRMIGGILVAAAFTVLTRRLRWKIDAGDEANALKRAPSLTRLAWFFVFINAVCGPALGVACFQWALSLAPSGIVLPIVATTPVVAIPLTFWIDGDKPSRRSVIGGIIAVAGTVALARAAG